MTDRPANRNRDSRGILFALWLVCLPVAWFFGHLIHDIPIRNAQVAAAGLGWSGEPGEVTIQRKQRVVEGGGRGGSTTNIYCFGNFVAARGAERLADIRVHIDGKCTKGRVVTARLVRGDPRNWIDGNDRDQAYAGAGWVSALLVGVFMGVFLLLIGGVPIACTVLFPLMILRSFRQGDP